MSNVTLGTITNKDDAAYPSDLKVLGDIVEALGMSDVSDPNDQVGLLGGVVPVDKTLEQMIADVIEEGEPDSLGVRVINPDKRDQFGALVGSDAVPIPGSPFVSNVTGTVCIIDTQGYSTINLDLSGSWVGTVNCYSTNDFYNTNIVLGINEAAPQIQISSLINVGNYSFPTRGGRFFIVKFTCTSGQLVVVPILRNGCFQPFTVASLAWINGNPVTAPGINGALTVGGPNSPGSANSGINPLQIGGLDATGKVRMFLSDTNGAQVAAGALPVGYAFGQYNNPPYHSPLVAMSAAQSTVNPVTIGGVDPYGISRAKALTPAGRTEISPDVPGPAGQSIIDLLTQIAASMRVNNWYLAEIYRVSNGGLADDPDAILNEYLAQQPIN